MYILAWICVAASSAVIIVATPTTNAVEYEPYTTLKRNKLIGLYGFAENGSNVIPLRDYSRDRYDVSLSITLIGAKIVNSTFYFLPQIDRESCRCKFIF